MKRGYLIFLLIPCVLYAFGQQRSRSPEKRANTVAESVRWTQQHFAPGRIPPFSFVYGGRESRSFITGWEFRAEKLPQGSPLIQEVQYSWRDRKSGFIATCLVTCYLDFPAVEWTVRFRNGPSGNSPVLESVKAIDQKFSFALEGKVTLYHSKGSSAERSDFQETADLIGAGRNIRMAPMNGRSSNRTAFPFFNVSMPGNQGILTAIGWTGKWYADVKQADNKSWSLEAGMDRLKLFLYPDEEIRTPEICLMFWKGEDRLAGHNLFRQFVLKHHSRQINGTFAEPPLSFTLGYGGPPPCDLFNCITEKYCVAMVERHQQFGLVPEVFWIDAGWYAGCGAWWTHAGNWTVDSTRFPNGLKPVTDAIHQAGSKLLLWFEPERVAAGTLFDKLPSDYLIRIPDTLKNPDIVNYDSDMALFNLGNPEACRWLTEYISNFIRENGIDHYRQDFNFDPTPYWNYNDPKDRTGISEIRHIEGLYRFWDGLLGNFPNLIIDNCASGGRRIDLETVSRSTPLLVTDYNSLEHSGHQSHTYGLNLYLPLHGVGCAEPTRYSLRSEMSSGLVIIWDLTNATAPLSRMDSLFDDFKRLRPYYYGDYYPLVPNVNITSDSIWMAYELNRPDQGDGIVMAFRRPLCSTDSLSVKLHGLEPEKQYIVTIEDSGVVTTQNGEKLMQGLLLECSEKPGSLLIRYERK
ncbi:MAG: alpha-galactosidase [Bacteroidota bacterium]